MTTEISAPNRFTAGSAGGGRARGDHANAGTHGAKPARSLDPDAIACHAGRIYRAAYGLCGSRHDAEDLVQDTYELVLRRPRVLRRDDDLAYLMRTLRNAWVSKLRMRKVRAVVPPGNAIENIAAPIDPIEQSIKGSVVYDALQQLTEPLREAVVAVDVCGLSYREAARALGTKQGTIMSRLHRGRGQLAEAVGPYR
jgi:RNA polymerase sigma-70 factor (ECF subfamily)